MNKLQKPLYKTAPLCYNTVKSKQRKEPHTMKAVVTVTGKDTKGIIAKVSALCSEHGANIVEITQSVLSEYFAMVMLIELDDLTCDFGNFVDRMKVLGRENNLIIDVMHEDIFNSMHRI